MSRRFNRDKASMRGRWRDLKLTIEPLESRQLLAGLNVWVVNDQNGSRGYDEQADSSAASRLVYIDLDRDGTFDNSEPLKVTDRDGLATFKDLSPGTYQVGILGSNSAQVQSFPVASESLGLRRNTASSEMVLASSNLEHVWSISDAGLVSVLDASRRIERQFPLGGTLHSFVQPIGATAWGIVQRTGSQATHLLKLDLESNSSSDTPISGLPDGSRLVKLSRVGEQLVVSFTTPDGPRVAGLNVTESGVALGRVAGREIATAMVGSPAGRWLATAFNSIDGKSQITVSDVLNGGSVSSSIELDGRVSGAHFTSDGKHLLATLVGGGTRVIRIGNDLQLVATLAEAAEPVSVNSVDGKFITGNARIPSELIVWNAATWQPAGRISLPSTDSSALPTVKSTVTDRWGERLLIATTGGTYEVDTSVPIAAQAVVDDSRVANVSLGVRVIGENAAPVVSERAVRSLSEDTLDQANTSGLVEFVRDPNGNPLWFTVDTLARHGRLSLAPDGSWRYQPVEDFYGSDQAVLQVHDGMASSLLTVNINVAGVNDPPRGMQVAVSQIEELAPQNTSLGFITVFDPDRDSQYTFTSSDPRFISVNGQLLLKAQGLLDFETEKTIVFDVTATDVSRPDFSITHRTTLVIADVNEPPTEIRISDSRVAENRPGAVVGVVTVVDPDQTDSVIYGVSDGRFEIVNGELRLRQTAVLDFEQAPNVVLVLTATPVSNPGDPIYSTVTIEVGNENDPPSGITLSSNVVRARTQGFVVGTVTVQDSDFGEQFTFSVSDARFEVVGLNLKLKAGISIRLGGESRIPLAITATAQNGDSVTENFELLVQENSNSQQNPRNPLDVDNDGMVTPRDALLLVNYLNQFGPQFLDPNLGSGEGPLDPGQYIDVNNDGAITPIDVLIIINYLNSPSKGRLGGEGEGLAADQSVQAASDPTDSRILPSPASSAARASSVERPIGEFESRDQRSAGRLELIRSMDQVALDEKIPGRGTPSRRTQPGFELSQANSSRGVDFRDPKELDLELEALLDELSLEQFGRRLDE